MCWNFPFREPPQVPLGNGMRVLTDMFVSVLCHVSLNVTLSDLVYMCVTCSTWFDTGGSRPEKDLKGMRFLRFCSLVSLRVSTPSHGAIVCRRRQREGRKEKEKEKEEGEDRARLCCFFLCFHFASFRSVGRDK